MSQHFLRGTIVMSEEQGGEKKNSDVTDRHFGKKHVFKKKKKKKGLGYWAVFMLCKLYLNGAPRIFKFFRYFAKKKKEQNFQLKIPPAPVLLRQGTNPFLMFDLLTLLFVKTGFILFFYSESVRPTVLK